MFVTLQLGNPISVSLVSLFHVTCFYLSRSLSFNGLIVALLPLSKNNLLDCFEALTTPSTTAASSTTVSSTSTSTTPLTSTTAGSTMTTTSFFSTSSEIVDFVQHQIIEEHTEDSLAIDVLDVPTR